MKNTVVKLATALILILALASCGKKYVSLPMEGKQTLVEGSFNKHFQVSSGVLMLEGDRPWIEVRIRCLKPIDASDYSEIKLTAPFDEGDAPTLAIIGRSGGQLCVMKMANPESMKELMRIFTDPESVYDDKGVLVRFECDKLSSSELKELAEKACTLQLRGDVYLVKKDYTPPSVSPGKAYEEPEPDDEEADEPAPEDPAELSYPCTMVVITNGAAVTTEPGGGDTVKRLAHGAPIEVTGFNGDYYEVKNGENYMYISVSDLSPAK